MNVIPRRLMFRALTVVIALAVLLATAEAALVFRAVGPIIAAALGVAVLPSLVRGARSGTMTRATAWVITAVGCVICLTATIGLDPDRMTRVTISWYTCGVLAGAAMVWMAGHRLPPLVAVTCLLLQIAAWAGPIGPVRLGLTAEIVFVISGLVLHRAFRQITAAATVAVAEERGITVIEAEQDAFHLERANRLLLAGRAATPLLRRIIALEGELDERSRSECRVLEQTLRDEIRGRRLLNDAVRRVVLGHRERGAFVQVLDDGGLDDVTPRVLTGLLDDLAQQLAPVRSSRIVIRTGRPGTGTAITVVASTPDETAVALGIDDDERVDLWLTIPHPGAAAEPVPHQQAHASA
jgi:hypothetical protein